MAAKTFKAKLTREGPGGGWTFLTVPFNVEKVWATRARRVEKTLSMLARQAKIM